MGYSITISQNYLPYLPDGLTLTLHIKFEIPTAMLQKQLN
ncbi:hypothetical protein HMPREF3202_01364 [Prevotella bivia]|uniref:Uncharacterized protein n=1 Tax=Prevotella bivia TaxID=28125 RepID=A0A137SVK6_9BACT|nr:hypothetical protein HMPREF3202_01364 [Prevotella bivia]